MAAANPIQSRCDLHAPCVMKTFATATAADLTGADAPRNAQHLPCSVIVQGAGNFVFKDINGVTNTIVISAGAPLWLPIAPAELLVGNTIASTTVCWQVRVNAKV
jgi:hypothetical protein